MDFQILSQQISEMFPSLSPQLRQAARHVLDNPEDVALLSMRGLAGRAGVQPSTMVRLAKSFDFDSFQSFQEPFQRRLRGRPGGYLDRARDLQSRGSDVGEEAALLHELVSTDIDNLQSTFDVNGPDTMIRCAKMLSAAGRVFILGLRSCYPIAYAFHYSYRMFKTNGILLDGQGGAFSDNLRAVTPKDVVLAISFEPYSRGVVQAVSYARDQGAKIIAMTDSRVSPLAEQADETLLLTLASPSFFPSISSAISLVQCLLAIMVAEGGEGALDAIDRSEQQLENFNAYWVQPRMRRKRGFAERKST